MWFGIEEAPKVLLIDSQNTGRTDVMLPAIVLLAALENRMVRRRN